MPKLNFCDTYLQRDSEWEDLCTGNLFAETGCGVCCAAMVADYKETGGSGTITPATMKERKVFTTNNTSVQWANVSDEFTISTTQEYPSNLSGAISEIKNQIDRYQDPVILRVSNDAKGYKHYVVAYGYTGSCSNASDVLVKDPYYDYETLDEVFNTWPNFKFLQRLL